MAMDDLYLLVKGLLIDGEIARPERWENLLPLGKWETRKVVQVFLNTIYDAAGYQSYQGYALLKNDQGVVGAAEFNSLWLQGWVSESFHQDFLSKSKKGHRRDKQL